MADLNDPLQDKFHRHGGRGADAYTADLTAKMDFDLTSALRNSPARGR